MDLGSNQLLTEISTSGIFWVPEGGGAKGSWRVGLTTLPLSYSNRLEVLEASTSWISLLFLLVLGFVCVREKQRERESDWTTQPVRRLVGQTFILSVSQYARGSIGLSVCQKIVFMLERVCSQTQLCQLRCFNDYTRQLHVSAPTGHLQVVFKRT